MSQAGRSHNTTANFAGFQKAGKFRPATIDDIPKPEYYGQCLYYFSPRTIVVEDMAKTRNKINDGKMKDSGKSTKSK